ncbi:MAG TPA: metal ABC transporter ATP-binding protein [Thermoanaerobaculia bacterium]|nr:metal ABC transporter ATP-binding protein [Thermoanaerobaculia bacterium]
MSAPGSSTSSAAAGEPLLVAEHVTAGYGRDVVLADVSLTVRRGDFLAVLGPNGGGKTTLLKVLLGLLEPWSGRVEHRHSQRGGALGYVPQHATFERSFPARVRDVVLMGRLGRRGLLRRYTRDDRAAAAAALEEVGLTGLSAEPVEELSGGQLQRTLIARALAGDPEILLLDEPLASVDPEMRGRLVRLLGELNRRIPLVVVTHDLTPFGATVRQIACVNRRLHYHPEGKLTREALEEVYGCPVELVSHGVPHRVLAAHP